MMRVHHPLFGLLCLCFVPTVVPKTRAQNVSSQYHVNSQQLQSTLVKLSDYGPVNAQVWDSFAEGLSFVPGDFDDPTSYQALKSQLEEVDRLRGTEGNRLFYLATPPTVFTLVARNLHKAGLVTPNATG